ncbi:hypothetical protein KAR91_47495 [Candidatus Pacearchaeota archaeon]|nr:hypothetical protein [Candidatus Pacearchaeota archaeon]
MKLYIAIWADRHTDITAHPFSEKGAAIGWARLKAKEYSQLAGDGSDYEEHDYGLCNGWVFYANYSCEGDCIYVIETELDKEI